MLDYHELREVLQIYYHVPKAYKRQFAFIREVLRNTLEHPPRRKARFDSNFEEIEGGGYVHELDESAMERNGMRQSPIMPTSIAMETAVTGATTIEMVVSKSPRTEDDFEAGSPTPIPHALDRDSIKSASQQRLQKHKTSSRFTTGREDSFIRNWRVTKPKRVMGEVPRPRIQTDDVCDYVHT